MVYIDSSPTDYIEWKLEMCDGFEIIRHARTRSDVELDHVISRHGLLRIDGRVGSGRLVLEQTDGLLDGRQRVDHETGRGKKNTRTAPFSIN